MEKQAIIIKSIGNDKYREYIKNKVDIIINRQGRKEFEEKVAQKIKMKSIENNQTSISTINTAKRVLKKMRKEIKAENINEIVSEIYRKYISMHASNKDSVNRDIRE